MIEVWLTLVFGLGGGMSGAVVIPYPYASYEACVVGGEQAKERRDYIPYYGYTCVTTQKPVIDPR
jgi:hypothetical protein